MSNKTKCVKHRGGYCAVAGPCDEDSTTVATKCGFWIVLPWGIEDREPTCLECRERLRTTDGQDERTTP